jgi:ATP-dependent helicase/nuclease subunit A
VFLASQAPDAPPEPVVVESVETGLQAGQSAGLEAGPTGRRFGTLVHAVLRDVPLDANPAAIGRWAQLNARIVGAPSEEIEAACARVGAALSHPLLDRARAAKRKHREYPIMLRVDGGRLMEGVIDLAFVEDNAWIVVDFKTGEDISGSREQYQRQLQWYACALTRLTGLAARAYLLGV